MVRTSSLLTVIVSTALWEHSDGVSKELASDENETNPPPSLGERQPPSGVDESDSPEVMYDEWWILDSNVRRFKDVLLDAERIPSRCRFAAFSVGSPRNAAVVCTWTLKQARFRKVLKIDIRDASCDFWLEQWDKIEATPFRPLRKR